MKPEIYKEKERGKKKVNLALENVDGTVCLDAVDSNGAWVANLIVFEEDRAYAPPNAEYRLEEEDYDTSFTDWDRSGKLKLD